MVKPVPYHETRTYFRKKKKSWAAEHCLAFGLRGRGQKPNLEGAPKRKTQITLSPPCAPPLPQGRRYTEPLKHYVSLHWQPIESYRWHTCFYLFRVLTLTICAHQRFVCFVISFSAAVAVPHSVRGRRGTVTWRPSGGGIFLVLL